MHKHDHHVHHNSHVASPEASKDFLGRFIIVTVLLVPLAIFSEPAVKYLGVRDFAGRVYIEFGLATIIFYFGLVFFQHAKHEIKSRQYGMMTLVSIAIGAGYLFSAASLILPQTTGEFYLEISTLIWVLLFGHYLEAKSSTAAGNALQEVAKLLPKKARLIKSDKEYDVEIEELQTGDVVRILAGEKVPADGVIIKGSSNFNEAHISGESKPLKKDKGEMVVAGAICIDGSVDVRLMKVGENSTIGQIKKLISQAGKTKPSAQRLADRAASWLTFAAVSVSVFTIIIWFFVVGSPLAFALTLAITVLVIACPHALGLAIPTVSTIATRLAVKNGLFIKDMAKLEIAQKADWVVFDKTGTLTEGNFAVTSVIINNQGPNSKQTHSHKLSNEQKNLIQIAASIESHSSHVIGQSIVAYARKKGIKPQKVTNIKSIAGKGIEGKIGKKKYFVGRHESIPVAVVSQGELLGEIVLADEIKKESKKAVDELHDLGLRVAMLTGDSEDVAIEVSGKLDIDTYFAEIPPEDKYKILQYLQSPNKFRDLKINNLKLSENWKLEIGNSTTNVVVMVGDGVNDAPALTQADVGIAVGAGTDVAVEAGDVVLTSSDPEAVVSFIKLSRKTYSKMIQNLWWALGYNIVAIPAAAGLFIPFGFRLTPAVGALLMSLSSVIVVANALTLRKARIK